MCCSAIGDEVGDDSLVHRPGVRITGMGIVSSIGHDVSAFARSLAEGRSGIRGLRCAAAAAPPVAIGAEIDGFDFEGLLSHAPGVSDDLKRSARQTGRRSPFAVQASILAAVEAWSAARLRADAIPAERLGLVIAGHNTTRHYQHTLADDFQRDPEYLSPRYALHYQDSDQVGVISQIFGIRGEGFVCGGASASGQIGVIQGVRLIRAGVVDACLVVGVVAHLSPMEWQGFHNIGAMGGKRFADRPEHACRPFDAQHEGFIYGQASACLVLESAANARERGIRGLADVLGGAIALHGTASADPHVDGETRAMTAALHDSGVDAGEIDYLNTHGSSSPLGDRVEIEAIRNVFGDHFPRLWLNATKSLTGHCLHAAGVAEVVATVIQMREGFLHPNLNLEDPIHPEARFCGAKAVPWKVRTALSNSFGFSGINSSLVLRESD